MAHRRRIRFAMPDRTVRWGRRHLALLDHRPVHEPKIAWVPLFIIWFGIGEGFKLATLSFGVFFRPVIATAGGVDNVPRGLIVPLTETVAIDFSSEAIVMAA